jgi:hypothetical protein
MPIATKMMPRNRDLSRASDLCDSLAWRRHSVIGLARASGDRGADERHADARGWERPATVRLRPFFGASGLSGQVANTTKSPAIYGN